MEGGIRRLRSLYDEGTYQKVLKILDSEGDYSDLVDDKEKLELYKTLKIVKMGCMMSCFVLQMLNGRNLI